MKKTIIAGAAASAVLAAMPIVGAFAEDSRSLTDNITVTVTESCTFDSTGQNHSKTVNTTEATDIGTTTLKVICNKYNGYTVTGTFDGLSGQNGNKIEFAQSAPSDGVASWAAYATATINGAPQESTYLAKTNAEVMKNTKHTSTTGDSATIVYKVATAAGQASGAYTGTAVYTLAPNPSI